MKWLFIVHVWCWYCWRKIVLIFTSIKFLRRCKHSKLTSINIIKITCIDICKVYKGCWKFQPSWVFSSLWASLVIRCTNYSPFTPWSQPYIYCSFCLCFYHHQYARYVYRTRIMYAKQISHWKVLECFKSKAIIP